MSEVSDSKLTDLSASEKREALARLLREKASREQAVFDQSYGQRSLWFMYQLDPQGAAYNIMYAAHVDPRVQADILQRAFQKVVDRHASLRTTYDTREGRPVQVVHAVQSCEIQVVDARQWKQAELDDQIQQASNEPFDLQNGPVFRVLLYERGEGHKPVLLLAAHHIALDFWALDLLMDELETVYRCESTGEPVPFSPPKHQYTDFVEWQRTMLSGAAGERMWEYWRDQLQGDLPGLALPTDRPRPPLQSFNGKSIRFQLSASLSNELKALAKSQGATLFATMMAAFQTMLYRYTGQNDILVGSPTAGRNRAELEDIYGYFLNPIVLRSDFSHDMRFTDLLDQVRQNVIDGIANQDFPFPLLVEKLHPQRDASRAPIFQVAFGWDKPRTQSSTGGGPQANDRNGSQLELHLEPFLLGQQGAAFDMMLMMLDQGEELSAALQYNSDLFDESTVERFIGHFQTLLESICADPTQQVSDLRLLSHAEARRQLEDWNDTAAEYPSDQCLHEVIAAQVERTPDQVAVQFGKTALTYRELDAKANQLARHLQKLNVGPDDSVGVFLDRSPAMLVAILGVWKSGGAYVPLSPGTPRDRLEYMLSESGAQVMLTESGLANEMPSYDGYTVLVDRDENEIASHREDNVSSAARPNHLAYTIFTSGSTGKPKGVQLEHRSVVNFMSSMARRPGITPQDALLAVTTLTFDISVLELFLPLTVGAKVIIASRETAYDGMQLAKELSDCGATIMQATPATWRMLVDAGWQGDSSLKVLCGGEAMPRDLADELLKRCGSLWNMYGPTETTIWSAVDRVRPGTGPVSIGHAIDNTRLYVLDQRLNPAPVGVPGDLYIGGDGLARGYLNQPELTAERFVEDPFVEESEARMYATGDVARFAADGKLEFLGRIDNQVKVSGYRIELGEIESVLKEHTAVQDAVVVARQSGPAIDNKQLVAYVIPVEEEVSVSVLREFLAGKLPSYMLPRAFVWMESFPLNAARKVDRKALPEVESARPNLEANYVAARNDAEETLAEIWMSVMGIDQVGVHDNFFELGGASIQSLEIASQASAEDVPITPAMLFQYPTIAELAAAASGEGSSSHGDAAVAEGITDTADGTDEDGMFVGDVPAHGDGADFVATTQTETQPERENRGASTKANLLIESLGVYLPPNEVTSKQVLADCKNRVWFPLEKMTGIKTRRMSEDEYSEALSIRAIDECLAHSKYDAGDIDLVISCCITRTIGHHNLTIEPNISMLLMRHYGFPNAIAFDVTNACTGMFTAIQIVDAFVANGLIRRGLVVSGEYISEITRVAQLEISEFLDSRLACLTVGDAGAAVILEAAPSSDVGFHELDMYSLCAYSQMCIGRLTEHPHGGPIMHVPNPMEHTAVAVKHSVMHAKYLLDQAKWPKEKVDHLIMHQTSKRSLRDGKRAINKAFGDKVSTDKNTIDNLAYRGNTATTSHMVAIWDNIHNGRIESGDHAVLGITGSGQTIGTAIYTFDDLPDRIRGAKPAAVDADSPSLEEVVRLAKTRQVKVAGFGVVPNDADVEKNTIALSCEAAERCLADTNYDRSDIELFLYAGVSRTGYISEPAIATMIAGELGLNGTIESEFDKKTFAFDVYNAGLSCFYATQVAAQLIQSGQYRTAMIVAAEIETNKDHFPDSPTGAEEAASAMILDASDGKSGLGHFAVEYALQHFDARVLQGWYRDGKPFLSFEQVDNINDLYLQQVPAVVGKVLDRDQVELDRIAFVLPPQISREFNDRLADVLGIARDKIVDVAAQEDLFTSSMLFSMDVIRRERTVRPGDVGLILGVGSGIQVGAATYHFGTDSAFARR